MTETMRSLAILTYADEDRAAAAQATVSTAAAEVADAETYLLAPFDTAVPLRSTLLAPSEFAQNLGHRSELLSSWDDIMFCLPHAIEALLHRHERLVVIPPGLIVTSPPEKMLDLLDNRSAWVVGAYSQPVPAHDPHPELKALALPRGRIMPGLLALSPGCEGSLRTWQRINTQLLTDPDQRKPSDMFDRVMAVLASAPGTAIEGGGTLTTWAGYVSVASGSASGPLPSVVECDFLWEMLKTEADSQDMPGKLEYRLLAEGIHDSVPLESLLDPIRLALATAPSQTETPPLEAFIREVRRAADPLGSRWGSGDRSRFLDWLYTTNQHGLTRLAHLYAVAHPAMIDRRLDPRFDPMPLKQWSTEHQAEMGGDLFDRQRAPDGSRRPTPISAYPTDGARHRGRVITALQWRWRSMISLVPGASAREERRALIAELGPDPGVRRGLAQPRLIPVERPPSLWGSTPRSLTVIGCFRTESGLGQAARATLNAVRSLELDFTYIDTSAKYPSRSSLDTGLGRETYGAVGDVNLLHANPEAIMALKDDTLANRLAGRFNAASWFWETADLPTDSRRAFRYVDELWLASHFLADVFGQYSQVPIKVIGLAAELVPPRQVDRSRFGFKDDELIFLFVYDALSSSARKNPWRTIEAFIKAFSPAFKGVRLVLKVSNLHKFPTLEARFRHLTSTHPAITVIDELMPRDRLADLMSAADVYVSLHAAEGFGLTLLESMSLSTPVICTGYSGNMDFTTSDNSWLVDFTIIRSDEPSGPYPSGSIWAQPSVDSAADIMRWIAEHPDEVAAKGARASMDARRTASPQAYADRLRRELERVL